tara:strand:+ start:13101 stop:14165 length:1065 start_codon:yes stop_codon:yes gene_type:complete
MAQRGTDIHQLGEGILIGTEYTMNSSVQRDMGNGMFYAGAPMLEEAEAYAKYVKALMVAPHAELFVESKVSIIPEHDVSGHVDACVITQNVLHVIDLKTGGGAVDAENNSQMMMYAIGLYEEHEMFYDIDIIKLHIVQNNAMIQNTNAWECTVDDLMDFKEWIIERARLARQEDSECNPSEKACQWCSYSSRCQALHDFTVGIVTGDFEDMEAMDEVVSTTDHKDLSMEHVTTMLNYRTMINSLMKSYEERVFDELNAGNDVDGFKLVKGRKNKKWVNETEAYDKLKSWLPLDDVAPRKLVSPTQANKLLGGSVSARKKNTFDTLYEVPEGALQLAPSSDKREAVVIANDFEEL